MTMTALGATQAPTLGFSSLVCRRCGGQARGKVESESVARLERGRTRRASTSTHLPLFPDLRLAVRAGLTRGIQENSVV